MRCADRCLSSSALSKLSPQPWPRGCRLILCARMRELGLGAHSSARGQHACQPSGTGTPVILMLPGFNCKEPFRIRGSIVVSISACHAEDPGSIPGRGVDSSAWQLAWSRACGLQSCTLSERKIPMCRQVPFELSAQQAVPPALATWVSSDTLCTDARAWPRSAQLCTRAACLPAEQHGYPSDSHAGND